MSNLSIKNLGSNYLARVIKLPAPQPHPNANKLSLILNQGQTIVVGLDSKEDDICILFSLESKINSEFLSFINAYSDPELNRDKTKKQFFSHRSRVKATKLRGILSEGYLHPITEVNDWLKSKGIKFRFSEKDIGTEFDLIDDLLLVEKYINPETLKKLGQLNQTKGGKVKKESRIIDNQLRLSPDYRHLKREIYSIKPDDYIDISSKWHGCNALIQRGLTKRKLSFIEKILQKFGVKIDDKEYSLLYASRRCLKSEEFRDFPAQSYYSSNVWQTVAERYKESIKNGICLYGEIVGYTSEGGSIQKINGKTYDYGCEVGKCEFVVFRITYTSLAGDVYEFSAQQLIDYCVRHGLKHVPFYYIGSARDKYPELDLNNHWHENFLNKLINEYLEKDDIYCKNKGLADEGIVLSKRINGFEGLKLKSARFILGESNEADIGEVNIEDVS